MALPLSYNVRNVRSPLAGDAARRRRHRAGGGGVRRAHGHVRRASSIALRSTGRTDNAIIVQRGSASELTSGVPLDQRNMIVVDDRVARGADGQPLASPEMRGRRQPAQDGRRRRPTSPCAASRRRRFEVRGGIEIDAGPQLHARPLRGHRGRRRSPTASSGLDLGGDRQVQRQATGRSSASSRPHGGAFESEIWGDFDVDRRRPSSAAAASNVAGRAPARTPPTCRRSTAGIRSQPADAAAGGAGAEVLRRPGGPGSPGSCCRAWRASWPSSWASARCSGP